MTPMFEINIGPGDLGLTFVQLSSSSPAIIDEIFPSSQLQGSGVEPGMVVHGLVLRNRNLRATRLDTSTLLALLDDTKRQEGRVLIVLKHPEDSKKGNDKDNQNSIVTAIVSKKFLPKNGPKSLGVSFVDRRGYPVAIKEVGPASPFRFTKLRPHMKVISVNGNYVATASDTNTIVEEAVEQVCIKAVSPAFIRLPSAMDIREDLYADPFERHHTLSFNGQHRNEEASNDVVVHVQVSTVLDNAAAVASGCNGVVSYVDMVRGGSEAIYTRQYRYVKVHPVPNKPIIKNNHCLNYLVRDNISSKQAGSAEFFTMEAWNHIEEAEGAQRSAGRALSAVTAICFLILLILMFIPGVIPIMIGLGGFLIMCCVAPGISAVVHPRRVESIRDTTILTRIGYENGGENEETYYSFVLEDERENRIV